MEIQYKDDFYFKVKDTKTNPFCSDSIYESLSKQRIRLSVSCEFLTDILTSASLLQSTPTSSSFSQVLEIFSDDSQVKIVSEYSPYSFSQLYYIFERQVPEQIICHFIRLLTKAASETAICPFVTVADLNFNRDLQLKLNSNLIERAVFNKKGLQEYLQFFSKKSGFPLELPQGDYGEYSSIYSIGSFAFFLAFGSPFDVLLSSKAKLNECWLKGNCEGFWDTLKGAKLTFSDDFKSLLFYLVHPNPQLRFDIQTVLNHVLVNNVNEEEVKNMFDSKLMEQADKPFKSAIKSQLNKAPQKFFRNASNNSDFEWLEKLETIAKTQIDAIHPTCIVFTDDFAVEEAIAVVLDCLKVIGKVLKVQMKNDDNNSLTVVMCLDGEELVIDIEAFEIGSMTVFEFDSPSFCLESVVELCLKVRELL